LVNIEEISKVLRLDRRTIERNLLTLEETYVIQLLRPFAGTVRSEIVKMPKVYFEDNGLRNYTIRNFTPFQTNRDKGKLLENFVFSELSRLWTDSVYFWRTKDKAEVDFVVRDFYGNSIPIEVKSRSLDLCEISRSFHSFLTAYQPKHAYIVNLSLVQTVQIDSTEVHFILPWQLPNK
jgi:predicted AAA+ superfamily ATPase